MSRKEELEELLTTLSVSDLEFLNEHQPVLEHEPIQADFTWTGTPIIAPLRQAIPKPNFKVAKPKPVSEPRAGLPTTSPIEGLQKQHQRYTPLKVLGEGGMGKVLQVRDTVLNRTVAMKVIRTDRRVSHTLLARFREEAQVASQLQHPGIIPIHDLGLMSDGSLFFTMKEVHGEEFSELIEERYTRPSDLPLLRRVIEVFRRVCETVAFAHAHQVVHRDLKPDNVMVGEFGEVLVLDWGLAKVLTATAAPELLDLDSTIASLRDQDDALRTRAGAVSGTPLYMAPEQARGEPGAVQPCTDVFALGIILYEILFGQPPFQDKSVRLLLAMRASEEPIESWTRDDGLLVPLELVELARWATRPKKADRPVDASVLASELADWLLGAQKREQAMKRVALADELVEKVERRSKEIVALKNTAKELEQELEEFAPLEQKLPLWRLQDHASQLEEDNDKEQLERVRLLRAALSHDPELPEAHERLADLFREQHEVAERRKDPAAAHRLAMDLESHNRGIHTAYLKGTGAVSLHTSPQGARVRLFQFELKERRLQPVFVRELGRTPLIRVPLEMGSYLLEVEAAGHELVHYPVHITRQHHWSGLAPSQEVSPIWLPKTGELGPEQCYVPQGWFWYGDDVYQATPPLQRLWQPAFVIKKYPITQGEYLAFLNDLVSQGKEEEVAKYQPLLSASNEPFLLRDDQGEFIGRRDLDDFRPAPNTAQTPMVLISAAQSEAYARWLGGGWGLLTERQWEKAARGVDGRLYVWGDQYDGTWCKGWGSGEPRAYAEVHEYPLDVSVYGVRGLTGSVFDVVQKQEGYVGKGGHFICGPTNSVSTVFHPISDENYRIAGNSSRLCRKC